PSSPDLPSCGRSRATLRPATLEPTGQLRRPSSPLSSRGLGRRPLTAETRVRIPVAVLRTPVLAGVYSFGGVVRHRRGVPNASRRLRAYRSPARESGQLGGGMGLGRFLARHPPPPSALPPPLSRPS